MKNNFTISLKKIFLEDKQSTEEISLKSIITLLCLCFAPFASYYIHSIPISLQNEIQQKLDVLLYYQIMISFLIF